MFSELAALKRLSEDDVWFLDGCSYKSLISTFQLSPSTFVMKVRAPPTPEDPESPGLLKLNYAVSRAG